MCSFPPSLQGLRLLQEASSKREEARKLEAEAERIEAEEWGKLREAVTGSKVEGLYGLLRGVTSSFSPLPSKPLPSRLHISPIPSVHSQPPQEPTQPETSDPVGPATIPAPVAATPATGDDIPADMQPLRIQLGGAKKGLSMLGGRLQRGSIHLMHRYLLPHQESALGCGASVPPLP